MESGFVPVGPRRTFEGAVEQIAERIRLGELGEGDRLPSERELAAAMQISRPTVREAVRVLADAGVLSVRPGPTRRHLGGLRATSPSSSCARSPSCGLERSPACSRRAA